MMRTLSCFAPASTASRCLDSSYRNETVAGADSEAFAR